MADAGMQGEAQSAAPAARLIASAFIRAPSSFPLQALKLACSSVPFPDLPGKGRPRAQSSGPAQARRMGWPARSQAPGRRGLNRKECSRN
jgi:hypothetical protein